MLIEGPEGRTLASAAFLALLLILGRRKEESRAVAAPSPSLAFDRSGITDFLLRLPRFRLDVFALPTFGAVIDSATCGSELLPAGGADGHFLPATQLGLLGPDRVDFRLGHSFSHPCL